MSIDYITREEWDRYKTFHAEQFKSIGEQIVILKEYIKQIQPAQPLAPAARDTISKILDKLSKDVMYLQQQVQRMQTASQEAPL